MAYALGRNCVTPIAMIKNYLKTTLRNLWRNKGYSFLNIAGLAIGITCAALIFLWVESEYHFDSNHLKKDRLYRILENQTYNGKTDMYSSTPGPLAPSLIKDRPEIANACRIRPNMLRLFGKGEKAVLGNGMYADSSLFSMFTLPFVQGSAATAFVQANGLVITETTAKKLFGNSGNVVGRVLPCDDQQNYVVTGVIKDLSPNSTLQFDWVGAYGQYYAQNNWLDSWGANALDTYVELKPGVTVASLNKALWSYIQQKQPNLDTKIFLHSLGDLHLRDHFENGKPAGGKIQYVHLFTVIAWIILIIACINFMNLATARSEKRAREVGVRKVLGAAKRMLVYQFIGEALAMAFIAMLMAVGLISLLLPVFNLLVEKQLEADWFNPLHAGALLAIGIICGLVAGSYPSFYLSSFNPIFVFKGMKMKDSSAAFIRKGLVVLQFTVSIVLIISTIIVYRQVEYVKNRALGYDKNNIVLATANKELIGNFAAIKQDLLNTDVVENAALSDYEIIYGGNNGSGFEWDGKEPMKDPLVSTRNIGPGFIQTMSMKILAGRDFQANGLADSNNVIINESFAAEMGKKQPVGQIIRKDNSVYTIIGVVKNFVFQDMYGTPGAILFYCYPPSTNMLYIKLKPGLDLPAALAKLKAVMQKDNPAYPFDHRFLDDHFNEFFKSETLMGKLSRIFAALAIIISCLGLFGLATYTAERRVREIGVRKVLGASVTDITTLLSADFLKLVALAAFIAFPLAWLAMHQWLLQYAYRISIGWSVFVVAGVLATLVALLTVGFQAVKAALANPVKSLRSE